MIGTAGTTGAEHPAEPVAAVAYYLSALWSKKLTFKSKTSYWFATGGDVSPSHYGGLDV